MLKYLVSIPIRINIHALNMLNAGLIDWFPINFTKYFTYVGTLIFNHHLTHCPVIIYGVCLQEI